MRAPFGGKSPVFAIHLSCASEMTGRFERKMLVLILVLGVLLSFSMYNLLWKPEVPRASAVLASGDIGVYWDANCTQTVTSIDWGNLAPGATEEVVVCVRNEGNETLP